MRAAFECNDLVPYKNSEVATTPPIGSPDEPTTTGNSTHVQTQVGGGEKSPVFSPVVG